MWHTGIAIEHLIKELGATHLVGVDVSAKSLEVARSLYGSDRVRLALLDQHNPEQDIDLVFCSGVFHHIPPNERPEAVGHVFQSLSPGGLFALWENNPWNPIRFSMSRAEIDREAIPIFPSEAERLVVQGRFKLINTTFRFLFPRVLKSMRIIEPYICRLPLGAAYLVLAKKPLI